MKKQFGGKWSLKYKKSINCSRPKGFSQKQLEKHLTKYSKKADVTGEEKGLGLNICVAILEEHGFKLSCEKIEGGTKMKIKIK